MGGFVGDKEMLENVGEFFFLIMYLCGESSWKELLGMCGVMPFKKAKLSWSSGLE